MGTFVLYFAICLLALIVRGHYRVPQACIKNDEENPLKTKISERRECRCHYTNFLRNNSWFDNDINQTMTNTSLMNSFSISQFESTSFVRNEKSENFMFSSVFLGFECS